MNSLHLLSLTICYCYCTVAVISVSVASFEINYNDNFVHLFVLGPTHGLFQSDLVFNGGHLHCAVMLLP